ncbi:hypothetical protein FMM75_23145 [Lachnospiraceae bacterium MD335]|nr:hypothetical protein [Lachnospiraceae bacterium MD335]
MKVTWLCSRKVEGQVLGYYTEKQIETEKDLVRSDLLDAMHRMSERNARYLKKGNMTLFGAMFYYSDSDRRQDKCIKELYRCMDGEDSFDILEAKSKEKDDYVEKSPINDTKEVLDAYLFTCYKTMYMPVTVSVPDDSTEDDIKKALHDKMSQNYDYKSNPYHLGDEIIPAPSCAAWEEELTLAERIEQGMDDISKLYMYEYEWLKHYKKMIFGRYYDDEYEIDWESMRRISLQEIEDSKRDAEEIDDYFYERSDSDGSEDE